MNSESYPKIEPQDPMEEILPDLYLVRGSLKMAPGVSIPRNMVIIRNGDELTLIGSVRMTAENESRLLELGKVVTLIRMGLHGMDDAYTVSRFGCRFFCLAGTENAYEQPRPDQIFTQADGLPFLDVDLHEFAGITPPEIAMVWRKNGGVLITSDALQHYGDWRYFNAFSRFVHSFMGFSRGMIVGPAWHRLLTVDESGLRESFDQLVAKDFKHMIGLHGSFCRDVAKESIRAAMVREFDDGPAMPDLAFQIAKRVFKVN